MKAIDDFSHRDDDTAHAAISALLAEAFTNPAPWERATIRQVAAVLALETRATAAAVISAEPEKHEALLLALGERLDAIIARPGYYSGTAFSAYSSDPHWHHQNVLELLIARLLRRKLPYAEATLVRLLGVAERHYDVSTLLVVGHVERHLEGALPSGALKEQLVGLRTRTPKWRDNKKLLARLHAVLAGSAGKSPAATPRTGRGDPSRLLAGVDEPWLEVLRAELEKQPDHHDGWRALFGLAEATRERSQPTKGWLVDVRSAAEAIGTTQTLAALGTVFEAAPELPAAGDAASARQLAGLEDQASPADLLKALAWSVGALADVELPEKVIAGLQAAAGALFTRVENVGARDAKAGGGCIVALGLLAAGGHHAAVVALLELGDVIEYNAGQQAVRRSLARAAEARGTSVEAMSRDAVSALPEPEDPAADEATRRALEEALLAYGRGDAPVALLRTLEAWRTSRSALLVGLVEALSPLAAAGRPALSGNKEQRRSRWLELANHHDPSDVPRLLATLDRENQRAALEQFRALERWPADPRLASALCELLEAPPYRHDRTWNSLISVLVGQTDPRTKPRLAEIDVTVHRRRGLRDPWRVELEALRAALDIRYPKERPLSSAAEKLAEELFAALPAPKDAGQRAGKAAQQADDLLAAIYEDPADDDLRRLYADVLLESGDARGELINLQLSTEKTAEKRKRERALLASHGVGWLGPLAAVFQKSGLRYERGFPVAGRVDGKKLSAAHKLVGLPSWSTFEELAVKGWDVPLTALVHPVLRGLRVLEGVDLETAAALLAPATVGPATTPRALERLRAGMVCDEEDAEGVAQWKTILAGVGAPSLLELIVDTQLDRAEVDGLLSSPLGQRLEHLRFDVQWGQVAEWVGLLATRRHAPKRLTLHETFRYWNLTLSRGADARWSRLACSYEGRPDDETRRRLDELLATLPRQAISELSTP